MSSSPMNGEMRTPEKLRTTEPAKKSEKAASTPPASTSLLPETSSASETSKHEDKLEMMAMESRKTTPTGAAAAPVDGEFIAPFVDLTNCTRVEIPWDSTAAKAILIYGVKDFTTRNYSAKSWARRPKVEDAENSPKEEDGSPKAEKEEDDDKDVMHSRLELGLGIHEAVFQGEKVFLEVRFMKDGPKTLMNNRCGEIVHNKLMAVFVEGVNRGEFVQNFLEEMIRRMPREVVCRRHREEREFEIYRWNHCRGCWRETQTQKGREMRSVILPKGMIEKIEKDMCEFLSKETAEWYEMFGLPYKRSYLFHGVPGTGKTSLITALAGKLNRNVCFLNAHHPSFSDDAMKEAMERLPRRAFLIMEDVDSLFNKRSSMSRTSPLTFTGLLNCLDGIGHASGQIVIMTTNYIDRLDEALIRAGRADMWVEFTYATRWQLGEIFKWFYHKTPEEAEEWKDTFVKNCMAKFPEGVTIAEMQQHFVDNRRNTAKACAESVASYDMPARKYSIGEKAKAKKQYEDSKRSLKAEKRFNESTDDDSSS